MIKGIIFDLGNTLIQFTGHWQTVDRQGAEAMATWYVKKKRIKLDTETLVTKFLARRAANWETAKQTQSEITAEQSLKTALQEMEARPSTLALVEAALKIYFEPKEAAWQPFPNAVDILKQLKNKGYKLGLYSNASDDAFIQRLVNKCYLRPWLSPTFSSAGQGWRKPNPEGLKLIAKRWELSPNEIVVVGDDLAADILGAKNAGMPAILVTMAESPANANHRHIQPDATASDLAELPEIVNNL